MEDVHQVTTKRRTTFQKVNLHDEKDDRSLVLAYGSWGTIAGQAGVVCNKGNPSAVGLGLLRRLSKRFLVAITPEHYTSKTCCRCLSPCGPWAELEEKMGKKIRGVRVCQNEECRLPQNSARTGASNIGLQFKLLFEGGHPLKPLSEGESFLLWLYIKCHTNLLPQRLSAF